MLSICATRRIFLYLSPTDMRKSFRGLSALVYAHLGCPEDGAYYVFLNRRKSHVKILYWDGDGLAVWYKRLEKGHFVIPQAVGSKVELDRRSLGLLLEGVVASYSNPRYSFKEEQTISL